MLSKTVWAYGPGIAVDLEKCMYVCLPLPKDEILQLKSHPFICMRNLTAKKVGNQKN